MARNGSQLDGEHEEVPLSKAAEHLLDECRMVLPGIQALFGFQLVAVFNAHFAEALTPAQQRVHLVAIGLMAVAIALIMTPAAFHRQTGPREVTEGFILLSTRLLLWSMVPLALGICLDVYLIAVMILHDHLVALPAAGLLALFALLWFGLPRMQGLQRWLARPNQRLGPGARRQDRRR